MAITLADQGLLSAASFGVSLMLIGNIPKDQYGLYSMAIAAMYVVIGYQNAFITTQMTVLLPRKTRDAKGHFCASLSFGQYLLFIPVAMAAVALAIIASRYQLIDASWLPIILLTVLVLAPVLRKEFLRSYFFTLLEPVSVLRLDMVYVLSLLLSVGGLLIATPRQLMMATIASIGIAALVASIIGSRSVPTVKGVSLETARSALSETMVNGRWAALGVTVTSLQGQSYIYLLGLLGGSASVADAAAARLLMMPVSLLSAAVSKALMPRWARVSYDEGAAAVDSAATRVLLALGAIVICYILVLLASSDLIVRTFMSAEYAGIKLLIALWGGVFLFEIVRTNMSVRLQIAHRFRALTTANACSAVVVVVMSTVLIRYFGAIGAVSGMVAGEVVLSCLLYGLVRYGKPGHAR